MKGDFYRGRQRQQHHLPPSGCGDFPGRRREPSSPSGLGNPPPDRLVPAPLPWLPSGGRPGHPGGLHRIRLPDSDHAPFRVLRAGFPGQVPRAGSQGWFPGLPEASEARKISAQAGLQPPSDHRPKEGNDGPSAVAAAAGSLPERERPAYPRMLSEFRVCESAGDNIS